MGRNHRLFMHFETLIAQGKKDLSAADGAPLTLKPFKTPFPPWTYTEQAVNIVNGIYEPPPTPTKPSKPPSMLCPIPRWNHPNPNFPSTSLKKTGFPR